MNLPHCAQVLFSRHALERMFQRAIPTEAITTLLAEGEVIAQYPDDQPYPSQLIFGRFQGEPIHAVVAHDSAANFCQIVTVYRPSSDVWNADFKTRKKS